MQAPQELRKRKPEPRELPKLRQTQEPASLRLENPRMLRQALAQPPVIAGARTLQALGPVQKKLRWLL